ncbi:hypothetical protein CDEST_13524 [Colletotrichum destructivum]|uniref:Uncharacterized protein n=1 Tax=Colletotrichum destructivum TaxID=34406 RepID=A0AAX4IZ92_9PEZI|nr:hypothetical protein CDEST_13524 [Colletotrichum destructivum]
MPELYPATTDNSTGALRDTGLAKEITTACPPFQNFHSPRTFDTTEISLPLLISSVRQAPEKHRIASIGTPYQTTGPAIHTLSISNHHQPQRTPAWALLSPSYLSPTGSAHRHPTTSTPTSTNKAPAAGVRAPICLFAALDRCVTGDISLTLALSRRSRISSWPLRVWIERHFPKDK